MKNTLRASYNRIKSNRVILFKSTHWLRSNSCREGNPNDV